ncbi:MAG TPA: hypothetical protein VF941_08680 [Clostridia bacterium]
MSTIYVKQSERREVPYRITLVQKRSDIEPDGMKPSPVMHGSQYEYWRERELDMFYTMGSFIR